MCLGCSVFALVASGELPFFPVLRSDARIGGQGGGLYLLPTNQLLKPWGEPAMIAGRPVDLALDSRKHLAAVLNTRGVLLFDALSGSALADIKTHSTSYTGIAFRPGDRELWASETARDGPDGIFIQSLSETGQPGEGARIVLPGHPLPCGIAFSGDGTVAYVAFSRRNTLAVISAAQQKILEEIDTGIAPFGVAFSPKRGRIFVSNRGGRRPFNGESVAVSSGTAVLADPVTGSPVSGTLSVIEVKSGKVKEVPVGLEPSAVALSPDETTLAVANSHSDSVSLIDTATLARTDIAIPSYPESLIGSQPNGLAFAADGKRLYVACGGNNAVAVLAPGSKKWELKGAVPTGYFPSGIAAGAEGAIHVVNVKGVANTANHKGSYNSLQYEGSLLRIPALSDAQIAAGTREVAAVNAPHFEAAGGVANLKALGIEHVFFIVKENRTYDQVFGDFTKGNGDPNLVMYGLDITPNHHALAEKYVLLDNFHSGGAISFDGHQWLMMGFVSDYVERGFAASPRGYAWNMADALTVAPTGFFWQGAVKQPTLRIYGEFCTPAKWDPLTQHAIDINEKEQLTWTEYWNLYKQGKWQTEVGSHSGVPALEKYIDQRYPNDSTSIPDQIRADEWLREFAAFEKNGGLPQLNIITLNNDHTNGTRPGSPTPRAMVADNDLALGRIVEAISKSQYWAKSLILAVEDDAQDGLDHVDGHRTVALAIGPYIRRGVVDSNHYNHTSMVRTIQEIFRIPPRTRALAAARSMHSVFTDAADTSPYKTLIPSVPLDEMNPPLQSLRGRQRWAAAQSLAMHWSEPDDVPERVLNRILWWDSKGYQTRYPERP